MHVPIDIITISREYGAGASDLATLLGDQLGWPVLERELVARVAQRLQLEPKTVEAMDEHAPGLLARFSSVLLATAPESPVTVEPYEIPDADAVARAVSDVILEAAATPPVIIVGHGGQCLLRDHPSALHVRLVAPADVRARRIVARRAADSVDAATNAQKKMDADRAAYVRRYHQRDVTDPLLYDVQLNTGRVPLAEAARVIADLVTSRGKL